MFTYVGNLTPECIPESTEDSTAGHCLKIKSKRLYLTTLLAKKKFRKRGNKEGAVSAFYKLEEEGLGKVMEIKGSKGTSEVSSCLLK